jgi:hypothetical protein
MVLNYHMLLAVPAQSCLPARFKFLKQAGVNIVCGGRDSTECGLRPVPHMAGLADLYSPPPCVTFGPQGLRRLFRLFFKECFVLFQQRDKDPSFHRVKTFIVSLTRTMTNPRICVDKAQSAQREKAIVFTIPYGLFIGLNIRQHPGRHAEAFLRSLSFIFEAGNWSKSLFHKKDSVKSQRNSTSISTTWKFQKIKHPHVQSSCLIDQESRCWPQCLSLPRLDHRPWARCPFLPLLWCQP